MLTRLSTIPAHAGVSNERNALTSERGEGVSLAESAQQVDSRRMDQLGLVIESVLIFGALFLAAVAISQTAAALRRRRAKK